MSVVSLTQIWGFSNLCAINKIPLSMFTLPTLMISLSWPMDRLSLFRFSIISRGSAVPTLPSVLSSLDFYLCSSVSFQILKHFHCTMYSAASPLPQFDIHLQKDTVFFHVLRLSILQLPTHLNNCSSHPFTSYQASGFHSCPPTHTGAHLFQC